MLKPILFAAPFLIGCAAAQAQQNLESCENFLSVSGKFFGIQVGGTALTDEQKAFCAAIETFVDESSARLKSAENDISSLRSELTLANARLKNAVVPFHRTDDRPCPAGWSLFDPAKGRMLIGAGKHAIAGLSEYDAYADNPAQAVGGEENVSLTTTQLPAHRHTYGVFYGPTHDETGGRWPHGADYSSGTIVNEAGRTDASGASQPHNNMPPYIALYFCKKD